MTTAPAQREDQSAAPSVASSAPQPAAERNVLPLLRLMVVQFAVAVVVGWATAVAFNTSTPLLVSVALHVLLAAQATCWFFVVDLDSPSWRRRTDRLALGVALLLALHLAVAELTTVPGLALERLVPSIIQVGVVAIVSWPITTYLRAHGWRLTDAPLPPAPLVRYSLKRGLLALCGGAVCLAIARWFYTHEVEVYAFLQPLGRRLAFNWLSPAASLLFAGGACAAGALVMLRTYPRLLDALLTLTIVAAISVWMCLQSRSFTRSDDFGFAYLCVYASLATMASLWGLRWFGWRFERLASSPPAPSQLESSAALGDAREPGAG